MKSASHRFDQISAGAPDCAPGRTPTSGGGLPAIGLGLLVLVVPALVLSWGTLELLVSPLFIFPGVGGLCLVAGGVWLVRRDVQRRQNQQLVDRAHEVVLHAKHQSMRAAKAGLWDRIKRAPESDDAEVHVIDFTEWQLVFYHSGFVATVDYESDILCFVASAQVRDVKLDRRLLHSLMETIEDTNAASGPSLVGAAVGGLLFGEAGAIVGAVSGAAGARTTQSTSSTSHTHHNCVDVYTRIPEVPVLTISFGEDESGAKHFFGTVTSGK